MKVYNMPAYQYLLGVAPKEQWVTAYFSEHTKCDILLNNMCETFNSMIAESREKAKISMLEEMRTDQMQRIEYRGQWIRTYDYPIPPVIKETIEEESEHVSSWRAIWNGAESFQVSGPIGQFVVNLRQKKCSCRLWQIRGIPCVHAIACIIKDNQEVVDYVATCYSRERMVKLYENVLYPVNGMENWPRSTEVTFDMQPPRTKRQRGRPRKNRTEAPTVRVHANGAEVLRRHIDIRCGRCGQTGHNRRTCQNDPQQPRPAAATRNEVGTFI